MKKELLTNLTQLVNFESTSDNPEEIKSVFDYIDKQLAFFPFVKKEYMHNGVLSVVWSTKDTLQPDIILNAHIDVVPASKEMFELKRKGGKLVGRGTSDMKFAAASFIYSLKSIHSQVGLENVSLAMMLTSDEERGGFNGVNHLVNDIGYKSKLVILPDAGENWSIAVQAKGASWVKITTKGQSSHASRPWEGKSAINELIKILSYLTKKYKNPQKPQYSTTVNMGTISGGTTPNQVADSATATIDVRYAPELTVQDIMKDLSKKFPNVELEKIVDKPYFFVDKNNEFIQQWVRILRKHKKNVPSDKKLFTSEHGSADHHYFTQKGMTVLATKPNGGLIHTEREWLDEEGFYLFSQLLTSYLIELLQQGISEK